MQIVAVSKARLSFQLLKQFQSITPARSPKIRPHAGEQSNVFSSPYLTKRISLKQNHMRNEERESKATVLIKFAKADEKKKHNKELLIRGDFYNPCAKHFAILSGLHILSV